MSGLGRLDPLAGALLAAGDDRPEDEEVLRELERRRPLRVIVDVGVCYLLIVSALAVASAFDSWVASILCFLVIGNRQYALAVLAREGALGNLLADLAANDGLARFAVAAPVGLRGGVTAYDADFLGGRAAARAARRNRLNRFEAWWPPLVVQLAIFAAVSIEIGPASYLLYWLGPMLVAWHLPQALRRFCEREILASARARGSSLATFIPNAVERTLMSPMNSNHYAERCLWPQVPYFNLPSLHTYVYGHQRIDIETSYWGYLRRLALG